MTATMPGMPKAPAPLSPEQERALRLVARAVKRRDTAEQDLRRRVAEARELGCTLVAIGEAMGTSHVQALRTLRAGESGSKH